MRADWVVAVQMAAALAASSGTPGLAAPFPDALPTVAPVGLQKKNGTWWLTSHTGSDGGDESTLFVSAGVDHVMWTGDNFGPPKGNEYERAVQQKYAGNRAAWARAALDRIAGAGFNTLGSWSSSTCPDCWQQDGAAEAAAKSRGMYYTPIVLFADLYNKQHGTVGFPDVFDPLFNASAWGAARNATAGRVTDPLVLGYFLDNEDSCPPYPEPGMGTGRRLGSQQRLPGALQTFLRLPVGSPGRIIAAEYQSQLVAAKMTSDTAEVTRVQVAFAARVARQYFQVTTAALRHFDPNHLILGCKFTDGDGLGTLINAAAPFVDVHALDIYTFTPGVAYMRHLYEHGGYKPFIVAEFSFQGRESFVDHLAHMGGAGPVLQTQKQRGAAWSSFVSKLLALDFVVGYHHFQYYDQPSDRAKAHNTNYGMVSVNDTEYTEMIQAMRRTNLDAYRLHALGAAGQRCGLDNLSLHADGSAFRGTVRHNLTGLCLTADSNGGVTLAACAPAENQVGDVWRSLANGRLQHVASAKCLDIDRSVSQSSEVLLSTNCSTDIDVEQPASWEHGADCFVMNFCRWLGTPVCGYGESCLSYVPGSSDSPVANVKTALCVPSAPELVWKFTGAPAGTEITAVPPQPSPSLTQPVHSASQASVLTFQFRCRATPINRRRTDTPSAQYEQLAAPNISFAFFSATSKVSAPAGEWSGMGSFTAQDSAHFPQPFPPYPIKLLHLSVSGLSVGLTEVDVEIDGKGGPVVTLHARLFGPSMGIFVTEVDTTPTYWTVRQYNAWKYFQHFPNATTPPSKFQAVGRFIGSSDDIDEWAEGITAMVRTGFRGVALPPSVPLGTLMQQTGAAVAPLFSGGVYSTPGGAFDFDCGNTSADVAWKLDNWANTTATQYRDAGFDVTKAATFAMADEPGWYFPAVLDTSQWPARVFQSWHEFLQNCSLSPSELGASSWEEVVPIGRSAAKTVPMRRRYYWSIRFFSTYSAKHFAEQTRCD
jgi:hypothetical protein